MISSDPTVKRVLSTFAKTAKDVRENDQLTVESSRSPLSPETFFLTAEKNAKTGNADLVKLAMMKSPNARKAFKPKFPVLKLANVAKLLTFTAVNASPVSQPVQQRKSVVKISIT